MKVGHLISSPLALIQFFHKYTSTQRRQTNLIFFCAHPVWWALPDTYKEQSCKFTWTLQVLDTMEEAEGGLVLRFTLLKVASVRNRRPELTTCWYLPALVKTSSPSQIPEVLQETRRMCSWEFSWLFPAWTAADLLQSCHAGLCSGLLFWSLQKVRGYGMIGHKNGRKVPKDVVLPIDLRSPAACEWPTREIPTLLELLGNIPYS